MIVGLLNLVCFSQVSNVNNAADTTRIKEAVNKIGINHKVSIKLLDGRKIKGFIKEINAASFIIVDSYRIVNNNVVAVDKTTSAAEVQFSQVKEIKSKGQSSYARWNWFQDDLVEGKEYEWRCRAGARYLYIDEFGMVNWCSQQRGTPGIPLLEYTHADMEREYITEKWCAPTCTIQCVHQVGHLDAWRDKQISLNDYNKRNGKGLKKETVQQIVNAE